MFGSKFHLHLQNVQACEFFQDDNKYCIGYQTYVYLFYYSSESLKVEYLNKGIPRNKEIL